MSVKSDSPVRPGSWVWRKMTSCSSPVHGPPRADAALQGSADAVAEIGMAPDDLLEDRDRAQAGRRLQHRHDLGLEHLAQRIRAAGGREAPCCIEGRRGILAIRCPVAVLIDALAAATATVSV